MGAFKSLSARTVNAELERTGPLWQRNYYERIVRSEQDLVAFRRYVADNVDTWATDEENPAMLSENNA